MKKALSILKKALPALAVLALLLTIQFSFGGVGVASAHGLSLAQQQNTLDTTPTPSTCHYEGWYVNQDRSEVLLVRWKYSCDGGWHCQFKSLKYTGPVWLIISFGSNDGKEETSQMVNQDPVNPGDVVNTNSYQSPGQTPSCGWSTSDPTAN